MTDQLKPRIITLLLILLVGSALFFVSYRLLLWKEPFQTNWSFLIGLFLGINGFLLAIYGIVLSSRADVQSEKAQKHSLTVIEELTEAQVLAGHIKRDYAEVLSTHFSKPFTRTVKKARLLLSTPSYGFPPLRFDSISPGTSNTGLRDRLIAVAGTAEVELVLFTPDAHYAHWVNTLILSCQPNDGTTGSEFLKFAQACKDVCTLVAEFSKAGAPPIHAWATSSAPIRLTYFEYDGAPDEKSAQAFIVLADTVSLGRDISHFTGRCFGIPHTWHNMLFIEDNSYFDEFKMCPYTYRTGKSASASTDEALLLAKDYALGRTSRFIFGPEELGRQLRAQYKQYEMGSGTSLPFADYLKALAGNVSKVMTSLESKDNLPPHFEQILPIVDDPSKTSDLVGQGLREVLASESAGDPHTNRLFDSVRTFVELDIESAYTAALYLYVAAGFGKSEYAMMRLTGP